MFLRNIFDYTYPKWVQTDQSTMSELVGKLCGQAMWNQLQINNEILIYC